MYDKRVYSERRERLRKAMGTGLVLLLGNEESPVNYADNVYPFRQDSSFLYFFGLDLPGLAATMDLDSGEDILYGDDLTLDDIVWTGPQPTLAARGAEVGVTTCLPWNNLADQLAQTKAQGRAVHFLPPYRHLNKIKLQALLGTSLDRARDSASMELIKAVIGLRSIKSAEEIAEIEKAAHITADMHLAAMQMARTGMREAEVVAEIQKVARGTGGAISFPPIVSVHGEILHNPHSVGVLGRGDMLLCDAGAETEHHYAADMTRTFPVESRFTVRQREIYELVLTAQESAIEALKPGVPFLEVHLLAARAIATGLKDLGLMRGDVDEAIAAGAHALFFPHGLGHMMGLDVHDMEDLGEDYVGYENVPRSEQFGLKSLRLARKLQPGFVLTVEPGIYFIPTLIDRWRQEQKFNEYIAYSIVESYQDFGGIRIEEDFLITPEGSRLLGKPVPKTVADVEAVRATA